MKRIITLLLASALVFVHTPALASQINDNSGKDIIINDVDNENCNLKIKDNTATIICNCVVSNATSLSVVIDLQKKNGTSWEKIKEWTDHSDSAIYNSVNKANIKKGVFRAKMKVTAKMKSGTKTFTYYSNKVKNN